MWFASLYTGTITDTHPDHRSCEVPVLDVSSIFQRVARAKSERVFLGKYYHRRMRNPSLSVGQRPSKDSKFRVTVRLRNSRELMQKASGIRPEASRSRIRQPTASGPL